MCYCESEPIQTDTYVEYMKIIPEEESYFLNLFKRKNLQIQFNFPKT